MSRTLTEEQRAKSAERKARFQSLVKQIAAMSDAQRAELAERCPIATCEGRVLSVHNQCLIATQLPTATIVGGFRQWIDTGRAVRKGEHGLMIWVPTRRKSSDIQAGGAPVEGDTYFVTGTVFDISQTQEIASAVEVAAA